MTTVPLWVTILLPFAGYLAAVLTEFLRNSWQEKREVRQRAALRRESREDRKEEFELQVLKDVYSALDRLARAAMRFHLADLSVAKTTGVKYASHQIGQISGPELDEEFRLATRDLSGQLQLLLKDDLREGVSAAHSALIRPSSMHDSEVADAEAAMTRAVLKTGEAQQALGARIRDIYHAYGNIPGSLP